MTEEEYAHFCGRCVALELLMTTVMTMIIGKWTADPLIGVKNTREDVLGTLHLLPFPDDPRGTLVRQEASESLAQMFDNIEIRLRGALE